MFNINYYDLCKPVTLSFWAPFNLRLLPIADRGTCGGTRSRLAVMS